MVLALQGQIDRYPVVETTKIKGEVVSRATEEMAGQIPVGRITQPAEIVAAAAAGLIIRAALTERTIEGTEMGAPGAVPLSKNDRPNRGRRDSLGRTETRKVMTF